MAHWTADDTLLQITEHQTLAAERELVERFPPEAWEALGLTISRRLGSPIASWEVTADRYVGVAQLRAANQRLQLRIHPKVNADIFFLADYAFGAERDLLADQQLRAELEAIRPDPAACLLAWYLAELDAFARRWLRRDYVLRREVFDGKVRGRLLVRDYVGRHLGRGQAHKAPCQYFDLSPNNLPNQILKAALRRVARLSTTLIVPAAGRAIRQRVDRLLPTFSGITDRTILSSDYNRLQLRGPLRHYGPMIAKSRAILRGSYLSEELGPHVQDAFLWDMSVLFEEALRGVLGSWAQGQLHHKRSSAFVVDPSGKRLSSSPVRPDYVITTDAGRLVLDAKYKDIFRGASQGDASLEVARTRLRISRADIYQVHSYGDHEAYAPAQPVLVYPVSLQSDESVPLAHAVEGFRQRILLLFFDIGPNASANLPTFFTRLSETAALPSPVPSAEALAVAL